MASIDLHLHTTASDGRCTPTELVERVVAAGIGVFSVTDHDTTAGHGEARVAAAARGITFIPGIEVTSVHEGRNVHVLAYGLPEAAPELDALLADQRASRVARAFRIAERLAGLGAQISVRELEDMANARSGKALARPQIAELLIRAGHVTTVSDAFDRYIGEHCSAYVPHTGAAPAEVVALVNRLGGLTSLAHPGQLGCDDLIGPLADAGMRAIEVYHPSHDAAATAHYAALALRLGLATTGGSDFHGDGTRRAEAFGVVSLPWPAYEQVQALLNRSRPV